jgi:hypothetical protein
VPKRPPTPFPTVEVTAVTPPATPDLLSCPMAIVITKPRCQNLVLPRSVLKTYCLKVVDLCYEFDRAYRQVPNTALYLYIDIDMGTWVVGA